MIKSGIRKNTDFPGKETCVFFFDIVYSVTPETPAPDTAFSASGASPRPGPAEA